MRAILGLQPKPFEASVENRPSRWDPSGRRTRLPSLRSLRHGGLLPSKPERRSRCWQKEIRVFGEQSRFKLTGPSVRGDSCRGAAGPEGPGGGGGGGPQGRGGGRRDGRTKAWRGDRWSARPRGRGKQLSGRSRERRGFIMFQLIRLARGAESPPRSPTGALEAKGRGGRERGERETRAPGGRCKKGKGTLSRLLGLSSDKKSFPSKNSRRLPTGMFLSSLPCS